MMTVMTEIPHPLFAKHADTLAAARDAIRARTYFSKFPESPSPRVYGETAAADGQAAFEAYLGKPFGQGEGAQGEGARVATEQSPFGIELGVSYPHADADVLVARAQEALPGWRDAGPDARAGVVLEILDRVHRHIFELANAVQFTTGQAFVMAFQAGGAHALDRALEAVAYAYDEMVRHPGSVDWEKPGKQPLRMAKRFHVVPRGVALVIGCNTFPTWNSYPGLFASLVTGNPVVVKPHPRAVLPLAVTVKYAREVLAEAGFSEDLVQLAPEAPGEGLASDLALRPEVRIVDYTGSTEYGDWLEQHARQAVVFTEKAGVNTVVVDSTDDFAGLCRNLGFSLTLYSGQMCTTPQNILVPAGGIETDQGHKTYDEVAAGIADAVRALTDDPKRGVELTGAVVNDGVLDRLAQAAGLGEVVLPSRAVDHPAFADAVVRTPLIVKLGAADVVAYGQEWFGPIAFVVATPSTAASLEVFRRIVGGKGALTAAVYSTDEKVLDAAEAVAVEVGVNLSANLTGGVFVNQSAAFSDFHGSVNPAANAALTDGAYVASRFRIVQSRRPA